jgi:putative aldouronate transport system permease protein
MRKKITIFDVINTIVLLFIAFITFYPVLYIISVSFSDTTSIVQNKIRFFPRGFNLEAYKFILEDVRIPRAYMNTLLYTAAGTLVNILMTALGAYPLSKKGFFGRKFFMTAIIFTMFFNGGMIPNYIIVQKLGLIDTIWALIIPNAIWTMELLILKGFYESIPASLYESAIVDGASEYTILFKIMLPLSKAALASIGLFYFMGHWNSFFIPLIYLNDAKKFPLQLVLREMLIFDTAKESNLIDQSMMTPEAMKNATIFISMIPVLIIYPFAQKYFVKGVMVGSIKG